MSLSTSPTEAAGRSIVNFDTEDDLRLALMNMNIASREDCAEHRDAADDERMDDTAAAEDDAEEVSLDDDWDWTLTNYDAETTEPQTIAKEVQRLRVLQSYQIVGAEREEAFDRLCDLGARVFDVPLTFVVLIDIGRQWFASQHGLGDSRDGPRNLAFCRYTIMHKEDMLIVNDCTKDYRFRDSVYVTGEAHLRFYAGVPLLSPEGHRLGTYCIVDTKPWHNGMTDAQKANLKDFAAMAMKAMVDRREIKQKVNRDASQLVASAAHDLITPLTGMRQTLKTLQADEGLQKQLELRHKKSLATTMATADMMQQICTTTLQHLEETEHSLATSNTCEKKQDKAKPSSGTNTALLTSGNDDGTASSACVDVKECMQRLHGIIDPLPKRVPVIFSVEPDVPLHIMSDDVKILRASLNLLSSACSKTFHGQIQFRVFQRLGQLVFECEDSRPAATAVVAADHDCLHNKCGTTAMEQEMSTLGLNSLASQVSALGGKYGYRSHGLSPQSIDSKGRPKKGAYFWFSIPIKEADASMMMQPPAPAVVSPITDANKCTTTTHVEQEVLSSTIHPIEMKQARSAATVTGSSSSSSETPKNSAAAAHKMDIAMTTEDSSSKPTRYRRALVIEDSTVVRKSIARALSKKGYEVFQAVDGVEGLAELQDKIFDVTFCDFMMPNLSGPQCVQHYRQWEQKHRPQFSQYIIGMSAYANEADISMGLAAGMNEYRAKPMTTKVIGELCTGQAVQKLSAILDKIPMRRNQFVFPDSDKNWGRSPPDEAMDKLMSNTPTPRRTTNTRGRDDMEVEVKSGGQGDMRSSKRLKLTELVSRANVIPEKVCLLGTKQSMTKADAFARNMDALGWKIVTVNERNEVLQLLKANRWGAVLLFDDLQLSEGGFVAKFREWEKASRTDRQDNVFLVRGCGTYSGGSSTGDIPSGFDGELDRSLLWEQIKHALALAQGNMKPPTIVHDTNWNVVRS
ncbi:GAF [Seminavis robusta]|uniref:GAF n=1 Tax=Seminavis robusta TaxID=568900 RepID=A0A9N8HCQ3_9STRA|nr:GAF [Seminavis robusta]|eukprot:Sro423_g139710.1 GAF (969) ;mRNA; f:1363-4269